MRDEKIFRHGEKIASAGSCFAANIVPYLDDAGFHYIRTEQIPDGFGDLATDNYSYRKFSAAYGNIYTARQARQLLERALGLFSPREDRWYETDGSVVDAFRPGLRFRAQSDAEFDFITKRHLERVVDVFRQADVFVFTLGLTEAWQSTLDGAVFPACPGTVAGTYSDERHGFINFRHGEVASDLASFVELARRINPAIRFVLTVSPVPLVATATAQHILTATIYSKSTLRAAAGDVCASLEGISYFPAYEIVTGPQAPHDFFESDRREPSQKAIREVMRALLTHCETGYQIEPEEEVIGSSGKEAAPSSAPIGAATAKKGPASMSDQLSQFAAQADCEEAAAGL